jgi:hypothetical protein
MVPTVVEMPVQLATNSYKDFLVIENETRLVIQSYLKETSTVVPAIFTIYSPNGAGSALNMLDKDFATGVYYRLEGGEETVTEINLSTEVPVKVSGFNLFLEQNVSLPTYVEVMALADPLSSFVEVVLAKTRMNEGTVRFIPTQASTFIIKFTHIQPLMINELSLTQTDVERSLSRGLRFLAQPNMTYTVYQNPDTPVKLNLSNQANLVSDIDVLKITQPRSITNRSYRPVDGDSDGVADTVDNCVSVANPDQLDIDGNGRGDVCDDWDKDGRLNPADNCPSIPNTSQSDEDVDGIGDACDEEESRFTERNKWVPWAGMGIAAVVLLSMFALVAKRPLLPVAKLKEDDDTESGEVK